MVSGLVSVTTFSIFRKAELLLPRLTSAVAHATKTGMHSLALANRMRQSVMVRLSVILRGNLSSTRRADGQLLFCSDECVGEGFADGGENLGGTEVVVSAIGHTRVQPLQLVRLLNTSSSAFLRAASFSGSVGVGFALRNSCSSLSYTRSFRSTNASSSSSQNGAVSKRARCL